MIREQSLDCVDEMNAAFLNIIARHMLEDDMEQIWKERSFSEPYRTVYFLSKYIFIFFFK